MAERPKHWIKLWVSWLTSPAHLELSGGALGLGPLLLLLATWDGEYDSGGWLLGEDGKPYGKNALARATHRSRGELDRQLLELVRVGTLVIDGHGAYGFAHFGHWQETASATRTRRYRERHRDSHGDTTSDAQTGDGRRQTAESPSGRPTPTPPREGTDSPPAFGLARVEAKPAGKAKAKPKPADERIEQVLAAIDRERERSGLPPLTASQRNATTIAGAFGRGATLERVLAVVGAFGDEVAKGAVGRDVLNATTMFTGPSSGRGGGFAWGESLVDRGLSGGPRPANTNRRGPAPPSPRPTVSGTIGPNGEVVPMADCPEGVL